MSKRFACFSALLLILNGFVSAQHATVMEPKLGKWSVSVGYGIAGSFFVRSYDESAVTPGDVYFYKKKFMGEAKSMGLRYRLSKGYSLSLDYTAQRFSGRVNYTGKIGPVTIFVDRRIYHVDNIYSILVGKQVYTSAQQGLATLEGALGVYYIRSRQNELKFVPAFATYEDEERNYNNSHLEEAGACMELNYEWAFQPRMILGIKGRFLFTLSTMAAESIILQPSLTYKF